MMNIVVNYDKQNATLIATHTALKHSLTFFVEDCWFNNEGERWQFILLIGSSFSTCDVYDGLRGTRHNLEKIDEILEYFYSGNPDVNQYSIEDKQFLLEQIHTIAKKTAPTDTAKENYFGV